MLIELNINLHPANVPFPIQATKADGTIIDPTDLTNALNLYEENGADGTFVNTIKAQYTPVKINSKTGFYGVLIPKTQLTVGKYYMLRWAPTVDAVNTGAVEVYFIKNATDVSNLDVAVSSRSTPANITSAHATTDGKLDNGVYGLSALKDLLNAIDTSTELAARFTEIKGAGWTTETLKAIKDLVAAISIENLTAKAGSA